MKLPSSCPGTLTPLPSRISFASLDPYSINFKTRSLDYFVISGAMSGFVFPGPTESFFDFSTISGIQFYASPTRTAVVIAIHLWPVEP